MNSIPKFRNLILLILPLFYSAPVLSQLTGNTVSEFQGGNIPDSEQQDLTTLYNRTNLKYKYKKLTLGLRYEMFLNPDKGKEYYDLSGYNLRYKDQGLEIKLGHFNETLGNGILLRSYEIPGSIFEDQAYRIRYGFYRDLRGALVSYNHKYFRLKVLKASSLVNVLPPTLEDKDRRTDLTDAIELESRILNQRIGVIFMRNTHFDNIEDYSSFFLAGNFLSRVAYRFELAKGLDQSPFGDFGDGSSYGIYGNLNYSQKGFGVSIEYKNYKNIFIGSGISDPPTLIKEQSYRVLNRSIHVPDLTDESGIQTEMFFNLRNDNTLVINYAGTKNELYRDFFFHEFFVEYQHALNKSGQLRFFLDYSKDPFRLEDNRYSGGIYFEGNGFKETGMSIQTEYQYFQRSSFLSEKVSTMVLIYSLYKSGEWALNLNYENSSDPIQTDLSSTADIERGRKHWFGIDATKEINRKNKLSLFAGTRRGGPACTSGICYEVLDFEGVEIRLTTKF